jgi:hypothetical protein
MFTQGGIDLLDKGDRKIDPDEAERAERQIKRNADSLDGVLLQLRGKAAGGRINHYMIDVAVPGSTNQQVEFDRYYYEIGLIVDMLQTPLNDFVKAENAKTITNHRMWAKKLGKRYLAIEGSATTEQIAAALS